MELPDKIAAVGRMQAYIAAHLDEDITLDVPAETTGYSKYHAVRIFKELTGKSPFDSIRALRLTKAAQILQGSDEKVVNVAFDSGFDFHDVFTRAFERQFGIAPQEYKRETPAVWWFVPHPIEHYYLMKEGARTMTSGKVPRTVTVTSVERPSRKMILKRTVHSPNYWAMCEEIGCDWEGILNSIPEKLDEWCYCQLPQSLMTSGTTYAALSMLLF